MAMAAAALAAGCAASDPGVTGPAAQAAPPTASAQAAPAAPAAQVPFPEWRAGFLSRARAAGVPEATLAAAFAGVEPNRRVLDLDGRQPEFTRPIWEYLDGAVSDARVADGRARRQRMAADLSRIEDRFGVDAPVLLAIWGIESGFGANYGDIPVIESLSTIAWQGRRRAFGEEQLLSALRILTAGDITPGRMVGSWAGAMGHTQFIPTSFETYAVDFTGDGRRDLWAADALDALASTANYLARSGWRRGAPWGVEVRLPPGFDHALADERPRPAPEWSRLGVATMDGRPLPDHGPAGILLPAGARGPAFAVFPNFSAIKRYNNATSYAMAVGHLADRIAGGAPFRGSWPRGDRPLSRTEREEMQRMLTALGYDTQGADGVVGPNTRAAIRAFQAARGLPADGYDSAELLALLRRTPRG
jgi:membrane-bound lytic murein transglycosylase B